MKNIVLVIFMLLLLGSCRSKSDYIEDFRDFVSEVEKQRAGFDEVKWEEADKRFDALYKDEFKEFSDELDEDEIKEVNSLSNIYLGIKSSLEARKKIRELRGK